MLPCEFPLTKWSMEMGGEHYNFFLLCIMPVLSVGDQKNLSCVKRY